MMYAIGKILFWIYFHVFYKVKVTGKENIPKDGALIICSNHISYLDPMAIAINVNRQIHYMAKKEIYKNKFFTWALKKLGTFPVDRNITDMSAYRQVMSILNDGKIMGIFVQGKRVADSESVAAKDGVSLFALKSKAAVVPVGIKSTFKLFAKVNLSFGPSLELESFYNMRINKELCGQVTEIIEKSINKLI